MDFILIIFIKAELEEMTMITGENQEDYIFQ